MLGIGVTNFHLWTRVFTPKRSDKIGGRISPEKKTSTIDGNKFLDPQLLEKKNQQRTVTRRHEFDCIEKRIWWLSIMRLHDGAISRHSGSPRKFDDLLAKKGINIGLLGWKKGTVDNGKE